MSPKRINSETLATWRTVLGFHRKEQRSAEAFARSLHARNLSQEAAAEEERAREHKRTADRFAARLRAAGENT